jgi:CheY-like chemotaxis protein
VAPGEIVAATDAVRVLVVEDNPEVARVTAGMLDELGHATVVVHCAEEALSRLQEDAAFDLAFSDVVMPGMDGFALAAVLRERYPALPVLLTSGYTKTLETPQLDWPLLRKPFKLAELSRAVTHLTQLAARAEVDPKLVDIGQARKTRASKNARPR